MGNIKNGDKICPCKACEERFRAGNIKTHDKNCPPTLTPFPPSPLLPQPTLPSPTHPQPWEGEKGKVQPGSNRGFSKVFPGFFQVQARSTPV